MKKSYAKNYQVYRHWHRSTSKRYSFSKLIASAFSFPSIIFFLWCWNMFPSFSRIDRVSAPIGYIEMQIFHYIWSFEFFWESTRKTKVRVCVTFCSSLFTKTNLYMLQTYTESLKEFKILNWRSFNQKKKYLLQNMQTILNNKILNSWSYV